MTEAEYREKYENDKEFLYAWGQFVTQTIFDELKKVGIDPDKLLKIISSPRVKDTDSIIAKAFYRRKDYKDPYNDITDKVGTRFVALLDEDIKKICSIIDSVGLWIASKDRDYEKERSDEPLSFNYQSMHYVVSSKKDESYNGVIIPAGTPCEIQVRTLLQHAYSELTHDRVYKSDFDPSAEIKRTVARSMAFLETTDEYFQDVSDGMMKLPVFQLYELLKDKLLSSIGDCPEVTKVNIYILEAYLPLINSGHFSDLKIFDEFDLAVKHNKDKLFLNSQPIIYFIYYMCMHRKNELIHDWPYTKEDLRPYCIQLGVSLS